MPRDDDASLALAVHTHEDGALDRLVGTFERSLFNYTQRLLLNAEDAQEVVQDTFVRAHGALTRQYSAERCRDLATRPWLFRIARNLALNKRRGKRFEVEEPLRPEHEESLRPLEEPVTVLHDLAKREELARLDRALALLPAPSRELVFLRFIEEMSYAEIASTVGGTEASLRGKVFRALRLLREALESDPAGAAGGPEVTHAM
ncbi:MAG: RNA polymerase sigma factor [Thermoanaerobaculia bacterium]|nr:RNA polymerase sigma factor [Thermoanaerobaculia bacterium]